MRNEEQLDVIRTYNRTWILLAWELKENRNEWQISR